MNRQRSATLAKTALAVGAVLLAAGCTRSAPSFGGLGSSNGGPSPLTPAPTGQVASNQLPPPPPPPPPGGFQQDLPASDQAGNTPPLNADGTPQGGDTQIASLGNGSTPSSGGGAPITRNSVLGAYKVTTTGGNCQIILSLTKWTGGYRAASRGCPGAVADVSAWDVSGSQVVLKDSGGSQVASLSKSGGSRYDGQTNGGQTISLYR